MLIRITIIILIHILNLFPLQVSSKLLEMPTRKAARNLKISETSLRTASIVVSDGTNHSPRILR